MAKKAIGISVADYKRQIGELKRRLEDSHAFTDSLFENTIEAVTILTPEGNVVDINKRGKVLMKLTDADVTAIRDSDWSALWLDPTPVKRAVKAARTGKSSTFQGIKPASDGTEIWWDVSITPVRNRTKQTRYLIATSRDITDQKVWERQNKQDLASMHEIFRRVPALVAVFQGPDHIYEYTNPAFLKSFNLPSSVIGTSARNILRSDENAYLFKLLDKVFSTGRTYHGQEVSVHLFDAKNRPREACCNMVCQPLRSGGVVSGIFVHLVEITAQVNARKQSEELAAELEAVFSSMPDGMYIANHEEILRINQRGAEVLGYSSPNRVPKKLADLYAEISIKNTSNGKQVKLEDSTLQNALNGKAIKHDSVELTNPITGKQMILRTSGAPVRNRRGEVIGAVAVNYDLTEQFHLQEKMNADKLQRKLLQAKTKILRQQNKELTKLSASKDEFIALASHQLRTPATGVKQYIGMLIEGYAGELTESQREFLERAYGANERQLRIVDDILRVAQVDLDKVKLNKHPIDLGDLMQDILHDQASRFSDRNQPLSFVPPKKPLITYADHDRLRMALDNIIDNASKYTPAGKAISVSITNKQDREFTIHIKDEGIGIAKADHQKLFQKFSRLDSPLSIEVGGNGLGLYWTKKIVDLHGGNITIRSSVGKGTTFSVHLPAQSAHY